MLEIEKVDYAVIGAMAASVHGVVRASLDADAVMSLTVQEAPALEKNFRAAGFLATLNRGDLEDPIPVVLSVADSFQNRVDLLVGLRAWLVSGYRRRSLPC